MTLRDGYWVLVLRLKNTNKCSLLDWSDKPFSKRHIRRAYKRFVSDGDVLSADSVRAEKFFDTKQEMIKYFKGSKCPH